MRTSEKAVDDVGGKRKREREVSALVEGLLFNAAGGVRKGKRKKKTAISTPIGKGKKRKGILVDSRQVERHSISCKLDEMEKGGGRPRFAGEEKKRREEPPFPPEMT